MSRTPHRKVLGAAVVAAALLLSACGTSGGSDSSDKGDATTTTKAKTTTTAAESTTTEASDADAQARVETVDLTVSDFPDGWTSQAHDDSGADDSPIATCDDSFSKADEIASHDTDDFVLGSLDSGDGTQVQAQTVAYASADRAYETVEALDDEAVVSCINDALKDVFSSDGQLTVTGDLADDDLDVGTDNSSGVSANYTLTAPDGTVSKATVAVLFFSTGDLATRVVILSVGENLDPTSLATPIQTLATLQGKA